MHSIATVALLVISSADVNTGALLGDESVPRSAHLVGTHRALEIATVASLLVTGALGSIVAINRGTAFHAGRCDTGNPIFDGYGCDQLRILHGMSGVLSLTAFTSTEVLGAVLRGDGVLPRRTGLGRVASYISLVTMILQPLLGLVSAYPGVIGIPGGSQEQFSRTVRTVHAGLGVVLVFSYAVTVSFDLWSPGSSTTIKHLE